jgi:hypothetical protein
MGCINGVIIWRVKFEVLGGKKSALTRICSPQIPRGFPAKYLCRVKKNLRVAFKVRQSQLSKSPLSENI